MRRLIAPAGNIFIALKNIERATMTIDISVRERHREQSHFSFRDICGIVDGDSHHLIPRSAPTFSDEET